MYQGGPWERGLPQQHTSQAPATPAPHPVLGCAVLTVMLVPRLSALLKTQTYTHQQGVHFSACIERLTLKIRIHPPFSCPLPAESLLHPAPPGAFSVGWVEMQVPRGAGSQGRLVPGAPSPSFRVCSSPACPHLLAPPSSSFTLLLCGSKIQGGKKERKKAMGGLGVESKPRRSQ